jgi:5-deoxy-glucuronate isomerase
LVTFPNQGKIKRLELHGQTCMLDTTNKEMVVVLLSGCFTLGDKKFSRVNVFSDPASGFIASNQGALEINVEQMAEICIIESKSNTPIPLQIIEKTKARTVGSDNFMRDVFTLVDNDNGLQGLIVGETFKKPGNWSSWPPHKHDTYQEDTESEQQEVYLYKFEKSNGYGLQMIYEGDISDANVEVVTNNQEVKIQRGYHPVVASPSSGMYYLWALFGSNKMFKTSDDPRFSK